MIDKAFVAAIKAHHKKMVFPKLKALAGVEFFAFIPNAKLADPAAKLADPMPILVHSKVLIKHPGVVALVEKVAKIEIQQAPLIYCGTVQKGPKGLVFATQKANSKGTVVALSGTKLLRRLKDQMPELLKATLIVGEYDEDAVAKAERETARETDGETEEASGVAADAGPKAGAAAPEPRARPGVVAIGKCRLLWSQTRVQANREIQKLQSAILSDPVTQQQPNFAEIRANVESLGSALSDFDALDSALDRLGAADEAGEIASAYTEARRLLTSYRARLEGSEIFQSLDDNPYVQVGVLSTLSASLDGIAKVLLL